MQIHKKQQLVRIKSPYTKRWSEFEVDIELNPDNLQHLNNLAFFYGVEFVSICAGHDVIGIEAYPDDDEIILQELFADIRFRASYPYTRRNRLEGQQARLCMNVLASALTGPDTVIEVKHNIVYNPEAKLMYRLGESFLKARHFLPTYKDPIAAQNWWKKIINRLEAHMEFLSQPGSKVPKTK